MNGNNTKNADFYAAASYLPYGSRRNVADNKTYLET